MTEQRKVSYIPHLMPSLVFVVVAELLGMMQIMKPGLFFLDRLVIGGGWVQIVLIAAWAYWLADHLIGKKPADLWRYRAWRLLCIVFFAQIILGYFFGYPFVASQARIHLPVPGLIVMNAIANENASMFMTYLFLGTVLLLGSSWCSHLCYFGGFDNMAATLSKAKPISAAATKRMQAVRYAVFFVALGLPLASRLAGLPMSYVWWTAFVVGILYFPYAFFISRRYGRMAYCTGVCPMGLLSTRLAKVSPWRIRRTDTCNDCGACIPVCRWGAITKESLIKGGPTLDCTQCRACINVCRNRKGLEVRFLGMGKKREWPEQLLVGLVVIVHAVFLGMT